VDHKRSAPTSATINTSVTLQNIFFMKASISLLPANAECLIALLPR
jgi:hypothetical protein